MRIALEHWLHSRLSSQKDLIRERSVVQRFQGCYEHL
jgi:hypothetical protein